MAEHDVETKPTGRWKRVMFNETGQMSIFIALMFQVLFVFFAMTINIGLLVHDKINLQNAVDLGAYYGAERQAELLNEIAHINYQIRQDLKLLTWRYRVLGMLGRHGDSAQSRKPPMRSAPGTPLPDAPLQYFNSVTHSYTPDEETPIVCAANEFWWEWTRSASLENYCYQHYGSTTPAIPQVQVIAAFVPGLSMAVGSANFARNAQIHSCNNAAALNWAFTMQMLYAYKMAIAIRKLEIKSLKENLVNPDFKDMNEDSVKLGVQATIKKNLTKANSDSFNDVDFTVLNGLSLGQCGQNGGDFVMPEILTAPLLNFMYSTSNGGGVGPAGCTYLKKAHTEAFLINPTDRHNWDPNGIMEALSHGEPPPSDPRHSSLGFEKNPWCMGYVGVKASTAPRKPFAPFGKPIKLVARAFAQPFGGRIGPWYTNKWNRGDATSVWDESSRIDPLTPPRLAPGDNIAYTANHLPNYSRYPGDTLGMRSQLSMGAQRHIFATLDRRMGQAGTMSLLYFSGFDFISQVGDPLMYDVTAPPDRQLEQYAFGRFRRAEMAAIAPDLFDATYYSIDPAGKLNYHDNHVAHASTRFPALAAESARPAPDLGARNGHAGLESYQVEDQIRIAWSNPNGGLDPSLSADLYYPLRSWEDLLTAWSPHRTNQYTIFPDDRFGKCRVPAPVSTMIPGKCAAGGRVGYSVRMVSRNHLLGSWNVGGDGVPAAPIMNPPDAAW